MFTLFFREQSDGLLHGVQRGGATVLRPLESGASTIIKPFSDAWHWIGGLFTAPSENKRLKAELDQLRKVTANQLELQNKVAQLQLLLGIKNDPTYPQGTTFVAARVIARSTDVWYSTVTINAGSSQGVALYDAVVNGQGLVGRVTDVSAGASEVTLLTDQSSYVDAEVLPGGAQGVVAGSVTGDVSMQYVDKSDKIQVGQFVETSGINKSIFVRGIPVGEVESVGRQDVATYQQVSVKPWVDFHRLDYVMVVHQ